MLVRSRLYCCIIGVSASRIISELNHAARIASLECELAKISCVAESVCLQSDANFMNFSARQCDRRSLAFGFVFIPAALLAVTLVQKNPPIRPAEADSPVAIWDVDLKLANALPRNFRTTDDPLKASKGETPATTGLNDLRASGSGEFTPEGLKLVLARTRGPVTVFDLRQETHIFVNELPVSWYASHDWANVGRSHEEIVSEEAARVQSFKPGSEIDVRPGHPVKHGNGNSVTPQRVNVERAGTERDVVEGAGTHYVRVAVTDHARPLDQEVDRFVLAVRELPENAWTHFHCEAGLGRTTTFMVLYDMLRN